MVKKSIKDSSSFPTPISLGPVETEVMYLMWDLGKASVRDVYRILIKKREIAYTTVMSIMSNLFTKGVLKRHRQGRAYIYVPTFSKDQFAQDRMTKIADSILDHFTNPSLTYLVDRLAQIDPHRLDELEEAITRLRNREKGLSND